MFFTLASVVRMGDVLRHYNRAIDALTAAIEELDAVPDSLHGLMRTDGELRATRHRSVSGLAEQLMAASMVVVSLLAWAATMNVALGLADAPRLQLLAVTAAVACVLGSGVVTLLTVLGVRRYRDTSRGGAGRVDSTVDDEPSPAEVGAA